MEQLQSIVLIIGIIFLAAYSIKVSQESVSAIEKMNNQLHMMFIKN